MKLFWRIVILVVFIVFCAESWAQFGTTPQIINFPKTEYNASNQNWSIDQDSTGTIFVANNKGLLVYNGAWQLYELPGQQIVRAVACHRDRIYTGGFGEFGYWKKERLGNYAYHSLTKQIAFKQFAKEEIWKISKIGDRIYFQSFSTIYLFENNKITPIVPPGNIMYVFQVYGHIYVQILKKGIFELKDKSFVPVSAYPLFQRDEVISIIEGQSNTILVGSVHNGLFQYKNGVVTPFPGAINSILKTAQLNVALRLTDSSFAIGTIQRGVYILHDNGRILEHFDQQNGLQNNTVLSLKKDRAGNLWTGLDRGVDQVVLQSPLRFFQDVSGELGSVYAAAFFNGNFYIGSNDGLYRYDAESSGFKNIAGINWQVWSLNVLNGQLFCAHNSGVTVINSDNTTSNIPNTTGGWGVKILRSNLQYALQGTYIGLALYEKGTDGFFRYKSQVKGVETMPISDWEEDSNGNIWLKHAYKGLSKVKLTNQYDSVAQNYPLGAVNGISSDIPQNLSYLQDNIYTISSNEIKVWDAPQYKFKSVTNLLGLSGTELKAKRIFPMSKETFWVVRDDNQLIYLDAEKNKYPFYLKDFSLVGGYEEVIPIDSDRSILCGENGFALFSPNMLRQTKIESAYISSVFVNKGNDFVPITSLGKNEGANWLIHFDNRSVKINVGIGVYDRLVQYRFKLNKYGETGYWSEWQSSTSKVYSSLSSGDYKLEIQTNINNKPTFFEFTILPPWYWAWWSKTIYLLLFFAAIGLLYYRTEKKHFKKILLKQAEMEQKMALQRMEHEHELLLLKQEKLVEEVQMKSEDLANSANELIKRKKLLNKLHIEIEKQQEDKKQTSPSMRKLSKELERQLKLDKDETKLFEHGFNTIHEQFFAKLLENYPELTPQDLKLAAYLRMNLGSKEIAPLLSITVRGVELKRYRLRKKMQLEETANLNEFMMKF